MISNAVSMGRTPSIATPHFRLQALGCAAMGLLCQRFGLLHDETIGPVSLWPGVPICHTGGSGWGSGLGAGLNMGLAMLLVSLAPLRWNGVFGLAGAVTALLWVSGAGLLQGLILAADRITLAGPLVPPALARLAILALGVAAALAVPKPARGPIKRPAFRDGARCFCRCAPMMIAMMLTGAMSMPWMVAGALLTQIDETVGDRRLSQLLTLSIGLGAAAAIVATA